MIIELSKIHPSPNPIRKSGDEEKMQELAQSIKEQGMIVPIKIRFANEAARLLLHHNGDFVGDEAINFETHITKKYGAPEYEVVYGHRRLEAARRAGFKEVEAIVEGVDDVNTLLQAGIENLSKEDLSSYDKGKWSVRIRTLSNWTLQDLSLKAGVGKGLLSDWENYYKEVELGTAVRQSQLGGEGVRQTMEIKKILSNPVDKKAVAKKVEDEGLTWQQTRKVAESIAATQDLRRKEALLHTPFSSFIHDPEMNKERAERYGAYDPLSSKDDVSKSEQWQSTPELAALFDYLLSVKKYASVAIEMIELGKFAPEARPFAVRKIKAMIEAWQKVIEKLESEE